MVFGRRYLGELTCHCFSVGTQKALKAVMPCWKVKSAQFSMAPQSDTLLGKDVATVHARLSLYSEHSASTCDHSWEPEETVPAPQKLAHVPGELEVVVMVEVVEDGVGVGILEEETVETSSACTVVMRLYSGWAVLVSF